MAYLSRTYIYTYRAGGEKFLAVYDSVILLPVGLASAVATLAKLSLTGELVLLYTLTGQLSSFLFCIYPLFC